MRRGWVWLVLAVAALALAGCGNRYEWNQKITVEVETPDGVKSGSSVQHIVWTGGGKPYPGQDGPNASAKITGEAVVVELGGGKYLFALLSGANGFKGAADMIAQFALWPGMATPGNGPGMAEGLAYVEDLPAGTTATLKPDNYPLLVTFADVNDPKSVRKVDPADLAANFGDGVRLKTISVEMTGAEVADGVIGKVLAWLCDYQTRNARLNGSTNIAISTNELSDNLAAGSFSTRSCK